MSGRSSDDVVAHEDQASPEVGAEAMEIILHRALEVFPGDAVAILRERGDGTLEVLVSSDPAARRAEQLQLDGDEGPAVDVLARGDVQVSGDVRGDPRWPRWGPAVAGLGWRSVLAAPLVLSRQRRAVLTLYAHRAGAVDATHAYAARVFSQYAARTLT